MYHFSGQIVLTPGKLLSFGALWVASLGAAAWTRRARKERGQATQALGLYCGFVCLGLGNLLGNLYLALLLGIPYGFVLHAMRKPGCTDGDKQAGR